MVSTFIIAMVGWVAAALAGHLVRRTPPPTAAVTADPIRGEPLTTPDPTSQPTPVPRRRRASRLTLLILIIAALTALAASLQLSGR